MAGKVKTEESSPVPKFAKGQILGSKRYMEYRDALHVILSEQDTYSLDEVDKAIDKFMKGKVN